ncbi:hypothetical protein GIB67_014104 [Kingdonia uniflora]|uniref:Uncharacterized protein n=1 Tax=Kingdonia uniflora TaxID=39325 RepID=A0A7J7KXD6_9MAGN|nr:hypothetical protein GIB67_014104 [Kingdonia uniflora]
MQVSGKEARTNLSKTLGTGILAQPNPIKPSKIALKYPKKWMLKALPASGTTGSGEFAKGKRRRVEPSWVSREKVPEGRSAAVDDLKEVEERARLAVFYGEEDTSKMVARLVKRIWLGIKEEKGELKKANIELEKELARSKIDTLKEVRQLKASRAVTIGQLQLEIKANLDEMVEERDRLGHHSILKGYSEEEVDVIKADTYAEVEDEEEAVGVVDGLDGVSRQTVLENQGDDVELPEGGSKKAAREMSLRIKDLESGLARERETAKALLSTQAEQLVEEKDAENNKGLKDLVEVTKHIKKLQHRVDVLAMKGKQADMAQYFVQALEQLEERFRSDLQRCKNELE